MVVSEPCARKANARSLADWKRAVRSFSRQRSRIRTIHGGSVTPAGSGDKLTGSGWWVGTGFIRPITTHWYLDGRFAYESTTYDKIDFLGQNGTLQPAITQYAFSTGIGISYRL